MDAHPPLLYLPVNRAEYELQCRVEMARDPVFEFPAWRYYLDAPRVDVAKPPDEEGLRQFNKLVHSTTQLYWPDDALADIVWYAIGPYFAGDKTMDETVELINRRVRLYLNENR